VCVSLCSDNKFGDKGRCSQLTVTGGNGAKVVGATSSEGFLVNYCASYGSSEHRACCCPNHVPCSPWMLFVEYCVEPVCLSVCLCLSTNISQTSSKYGSVVLCRRCNTLCTSGFADDVMFSYSGPYGGVTLLQQPHCSTVHG